MLHGVTYVSIPPLEIPQISDYFFHLSVYFVSSDNLRFQFLYFLSRSFEMKNETKERHDSLKRLFCIRNEKSSSL